jgi:hypothetical protein
MRFSCERKGNVFASTHDSHFLMGCIEVGKPVNVVRLTYQDQVATVRLLEAGRLRTMMRDPLLRSTGVMDALFHQGAVVCEADGDRAFYREVYQRDFVPPKALEISLELLDANATEEDPTFAFRFRVEQVLGRNAPNFTDELFTNINLLQENVGHVDVFPADAEDSEYLKIITVYWEILPPGERNHTIARLLSKFRNPSNELQRKLLDRYQLLEPQTIVYISGTSGFQRYFGAQFADDLVVFENVEYDNAIYVMFENWEELSKLSRLELLQARHSGFERIVHHHGWEKILMRLIQNRRKSVA